MRIQVAVNSELRLHFGAREKSERDGQLGYLLRPPSRSPYEQLIKYLESKPDPGRGRRTWSEIEALASVAVAIRWGSYYAVLADLLRQKWRFDGSLHTSIHDSEMARINIEASYAMARWIELYVSDRPHALSIATRAVAYLPIRKGIAQLRYLPPWLLPSEAHEVVFKFRTQDRGSIPGAARRAPWRVLANAIITAASKTIRSRSRIWLLLSTPPRGHQRERRRPPGTGSGRTSGTA